MHSNNTILCESKSEAFSYLGMIMETTNPDVLLGFNLMENILPFVIDNSLQNTFPKYNKTNLNQFRNRSTRLFRKGIIKAFQGRLLSDLFTLSSEYLKEDNYR